MKDRRYRMSWDGQRRRWCKVFRGKQYKFPAQEDESKEDSYVRCWKLWEERRAELVTGKKLAESQELFKYWRSRVSRNIQWAQHFDHRELFINQILMMLLEMHQRETGKEYSSGQLRQAYENPQRYPHMFGFDVVGEREPSNGWPEVTRVYAAPLPDQPVNPDTTIQAAADRFLADYAASDKSEKRKGNMRRSISRFVEYYGPQLDVDTLDTERLKHYADHVRTQIGKGIGDEYAHDLLQHAKQFIKWIMAQTDLVTRLPQAALITIPNALSNGILRVSVAVKEVEHTDPANVRQLIDAASEQTRLYLLLAANCAMTPKDMQDLLATEVNWDAGTITRKRSKTKNHKNAQTVTYKLWDRTSTLLKKYGNREGLVIGKRTSAIQTALRRHRDETRVAEQIEYGTVKKTSSTAISHRWGMEMANLFLAHSAKGMNEKHYVAPDQKKFEEVVVWLEGIYFGGSSSSGG